MPFILHLTLGSSRFSSQPCGVTSLQCGHWSFVMNAAMSYRSWTELFRGVLVQLGAGHDAADSGRSASIGSPSPWLLAGQARGFCGNREECGECQGNLRHEQALQWSEVFCYSTYPAANFQKFWKHLYLTWSQLGRYKLSQADVAAVLGRLRTAWEPGAHTSKAWLDHFLEVLDPLEQAETQRGKTRRVVGRHHHRSQASRGRASADMDWQSKWSLQFLCGPRRLMGLWVRTRRFQNSTKSRRFSGSSWPGGSSCGPRTGRQPLCCFV